MPSGAVSIDHRVQVKSPDGREMGERKFTSSAAISRHIEGDINRLPEVRRWSGDTKNSPFLTECVGGDLRVHDLVWQEIHYCEIKSLRTLMNTICWIGFSIWTEFSVFVSRTCQNNVQLKARDVANRSPVREKPRLILRYRPI
jgi:hypothetical protein